MEKSLQRERPSNDETPACQARSLVANELKDLPLSVSENVLRPLPL